MHTLLQTPSKPPSSPRGPHSLDAPSSSHLRKRKPQDPDSPLLFPHQRDPRRPRTSHSPSPPPGLSASWPWPAAPASASHPSTPFTTSVVDMQSGEELIPLGEVSGRPGSKRAFVDEKDEEDVDGTAMDEDLSPQRPRRKRARRVPEFVADPTAPTQSLALVPFRGPGSKHLRALPEAIRSRSSPLFWTPLGTRDEVVRHAEGQIVLYRGGKWVPPAADSDEDREFGVLEGRMVELGVDDDEAVPLKGGVLEQNEEDEDFDSMDVD
ncbi:hypothetical protein BDK51DRAFT_27712 [Blyttiomyces helicus]|uniref:Uncharacterized protein n=1 Tax=Blyttiomyces helicus TaxID=388810 RepID=A0A4P9W0Y4_9FUNG|nr:hypothetical protein BDK51DRAFT_27712 [Blyttiomyces helicus]|eukprot:RKO84995.1 hypothetical protein BDK51DRAFT_27712 [Blyttiomyces helicus]